MEPEDLIEAWRGMLAEVGGAWVLFENGTCVTLADPGDDPASEATAALQRHGRPGLLSFAFDFTGTVEVPDGSGWVVASSHPDVNTFVGRGEVAEGIGDAVVGRIGRSKRQRDVSQPHVIHVEV
jgi:hypothetical protein